METPSTGRTAPSYVWFVLHFIITLMAWIGPFIFPWYLMITAYCIVLLQFLVFNRCLMNIKHDLEEEEHMTFYAYLLESVGIRLNRRRLKIFVRKWLYVLLAGFTLLLQLVFHFKPLISRSF
jgi:hypothetical protein